MGDIVYTLTMINLRCNVPDACVEVFHNREDAIEAGVKLANVWNCNLSDEEIRGELDDGDGLDLKESDICILPISPAELK